MPNAFFIHCWGGRGDQLWIPAACEILDKKYLTYAPDFPNTENPIYDQWSDHFDSLRADFTDQDIGIGHSLGAGFWFRYLVEKQIRLSHLILVAPTPDDCGGIAEIKNFFDIAPDHKQIKSLVDKITIFGSNNDPYIPEIKFRILAEQLGADFILIPQADHLSSTPAAQAIGWPILLDYFKTLV